MGLSSVLAASAIARPGVCTSSTRPASPYEGQVIYETDTDLLRIWNGSAWRTLAFGTPTNGTVLQTVEGTTSISYSNSTTTYGDIGLSATITPTSTSSKVLAKVIIVGAGKAAGNANSAASFRLLRTSTSIHENLGNFYTGSSLDNFGSVSMLKLDSPSTTSATTYKVQLKNDTAAAAVYAQINGNSGTSVIILQEISG